MKTAGTQGLLVGIARHDPAQRLRAAPTRAAVPPETHEATKWPSPHGRASGHAYEGAKRPSPRDGVAVEPTRCEAARLRGFAPVQLLECGDRGRPAIAAFDHPAGAAGDVVQPF